MSGTGERSWARVAAALVPVLLAAWVFHPITRGYFFADDFNCLLSIANDGFLRFVLRPFGGHNLLVRNVVFYGRSCSSTAATSYTAVACASSSEIPRCSSGTPGGPTPPWRACSSPRAPYRGNPRMRCAITLRWISDVPPMIVSDRA
jgi:hypothetical protein